MTKIYQWAILKKDVQMHVTEFYLLGKAFNWLNGFIKLNIML